MTLLYSQYAPLLLVLAALLTFTCAKPLPQDPNNVSTTISPSIIATSTVASSSYATPSITTGNPCAQVASVFGNFTAASFAYPQISAKLAFDCLNDVPLDAAAATVWLETLRPYIEWQSTTSYLKNPPKGYQEPAADIWAEFENIQAGVNNGRFSNEYLPNMIGAIFGFGRPVSLVSYSSDGKAAPKPYVYADVLAFFGNSSSQPSAVQEIDGQNAVEFLENWAQYGSLQDPDALYNNVFHELAQSTLGSSGSGAGTFAGAGRGAYIYPGPTTTLKFENGTAVVYENFARVMQSLRGIKSGEDLYKTFINPIGSSGPPPSTIAAAAPDVSPRPGYPAPIAIQANNYIGGYYLDEAGYQDVAVLSVASFVGRPDFQDTAYNFLEQAAAAGKKKLIVDVSANGGGTILQGYSLFLNLFPDIVPYGATRFRSHEAFDIIGQIASERIFEYPFDYRNPPNPIWDDFAGGTPFVYKADVDVNLSNFDSWRDKNPPNHFNGDNFTSIIRWNLSDPTNTPVNLVQVNGYGNRTGLPPSRLFEPENIVMLYDGYCASTCAIFSEFITQQAGIKTISIGGRPTGQPMQTVGGVKGTNNYPWSYIQTLVFDTYLLAPDQAGYLNSTALFAYKDPATYEIPYLRSTLDSGQVNVRDGIRQGDESQTPLQFIYEPADCRLYYTAEMTVDVTAIWEKVTDVMWKGDSCAVGGFDVAAEMRSKDSVRRSAERLRRRRTQMSHSRLQALEDSMSVFTDLRSIQPQQGLMLP